MHKSQNYLTSHLYPGTPPKALVIGRHVSAPEVRDLQTCLNQDAVDYLHSATVSFGDALWGINRELFTWATVKLYYSVFYAGRARLALEGVCLFYVGKTAFSLLAQVGQAAQKVKESTTHKAVLRLFPQHNIDPYLLSQPIDGDSPLKWLMRLREEANYRTARFVEPDVPGHFSTIVRYGVRTACQSYLSDDTGLYIFDRDHAILAYPLVFVQRAYAEFHKHGLSVQKKEDSGFFTNLLSDKMGPMAHIIKVFDITRVTAS